jgi:aryl-alcohol dehydrogenase-like predicted oxidoreductase
MVHRAASVRLSEGMKRSKRTRSSRESARDWFIISAAKRLEEALQISKKKSLPRYESLQPHYNLYERAGFETELAPLNLWRNSTRRAHMPQARAVPTERRSATLPQSRNVQPARLPGLLTQRSLPSMNDNVGDASKVGCHANVTVVVENWQESGGTTGEQLFPNMTVLARKRGCHPP